ncbi:MAG: response regulator transcription factor, partial [Allosphingosinicella sp.]
MIEHLARWALGQGRLAPARLQMLRRARPLPPFRLVAGGEAEAFPVYLVETVRSLRVALGADLRREGFAVRAFAGLDDFVAAADELEPGCVILDVAALHRSGARAGEAAAYRAIGCPTILLFGRLDADQAVDAVRLGAADLLRRPVSPAELAGAIRRAAPAVRAQRSRLASRRAREALASLSPREREVMEGMMAGHSSKAIGRALGLSHRTVEMHRSRLHKKLAVGSTAELLSLAWRAHGEG